MCQCYVIHQFGWHVLVPSWLISSDKNGFIKKNSFLTKIVNLLSSMYWSLSDCFGMVKMRELSFWLAQKSEYIIMHSEHKLFTFTSSWWYRCGCVGINRCNLNFIPLYALHINAYLCYNCHNALNIYVRFIGLMSTREIIIPKIFDKIKHNLVELWSYLGFTIKKEIIKTYVKILMMWYTKFFKKVQL